MHYISFSLCGKSPLIHLVGFQPWVSQSVTFTRVCCGLLTGWPIYFQHSLHTSLCISSSPSCIHTCTHTLFLPLLSLSASLSFALLKAEKNKNNCSLAAELKSFYCHGLSLWIYIRKWNPNKYSISVGNTSHFFRTDLNVVYVFTHTTFWHLVSQAVSWEPNQWLVINYKTKPQSSRMLLA